jgi:hypothetical protein
MDTLALRAGFLLCERVVLATLKSRSQAMRAQAKDREGLEGLEEAEGGAVG